MSATPAPWKITVWDYGVIVYGGPNHEDIADFSFADEHTVSISKEEAIANATLCVAAHDLLAALKTAIRIADEAREEWDKAPSGMRAGKLLIALSGHLKGYRQDIDSIHAAIAKATTVTP